MRAKILLIGAVLIAVAAAGSAQSQRGAATLDDVVNEIRALRADLKASSAATARTQMLTARLSLQEQRITALVNRRTEVTTQMSMVTRLRSDLETQMQAFEQTTSRNESLGVPRAELEANETHFKQMLAQQRDAEQQLRTQEADLSAQIAAEQNRWIDFNNRLDELERSLK